MRHTTVIRLFFAICSVAIVAACGDNRLVGVSPGDQSSLGSGGTGTGTSGSGTNPQGSPTAADTFSLIVHVTTIPVVGASTGNPVPGATATVMTNEWTFVKGNGADTAFGRFVTVGRAMTDANGDARFDRLPPNIYHVIATAPDGSGLDSAVANVQLTDVPKALVPLVLRPAR